MKKLLLLICLFSFSFYVYSQNITIKGKITDAADKLPIDNVNISVKNTSKGCTSNDKGSFEIKELSLPLVLQISHLAYQTQIISLTKEDIKRRNTIELNIELSSKIIGLEEVTINSKPYTYIERLVYDFEIYDSNVYIIRNSRDKKLLQIYSFEDYLKNKTLIPDECNEIKYDYSNQLSVKQKNEESYYRVLFDDKRNIKLKKEKYDVIEKGILRIIGDGNNYESRGVNINGNKSFKGLRAYNFFNGYVSILNSFTDCKFFYTYAWGNKCFMLFKLDKYKEELKYTLIYYALYDVDDWLKNNYNTNLEIRNKHNSHIDSLYQIKNENARLFAKVEAIKKVIKIVDEIAIRAKKPLFIKDEMVSPPGDLLTLYYHLLNLRIPIYIGEMSNNLYIFNFEKMNLYKLSNKGMPLNTLKLDSSFIKNDFIYLRDIFVNKEKTRCFLRYDLSQKTQLKEIDLQTGKYIRTITLEKPFIEKIRMIGNYIYYTARTDGVNGDERCLFKQKLD
jgi:hypothetical protein